MPCESCLCPGLGSGSLRLLHLQLEFTHLAEVWMRLLGPQFVRSCSLCSSKSNIQRTFLPQTFHFAMQTLLCPPITSPLADTVTSSELSFFCFQVSPLLSQLHLCSKVEMFFSVSLGQAHPTFAFSDSSYSWIKQGFHAQHAGQSHPSLRAWSWCPVIFCWHYFTFWIQQQKLIFLCVSVDIKVLGAAKINSRYIQWLQ